MTWYPAPGDLLEPEALTLDRARQVHAALSWYPHASLIEARCSTTADHYFELLVVTFDVEVPQDTAYDIQSTERLILGFERSDNGYPSVIALRQNFPHVPHLNRTAEGEPKDLCIYEAPWSEVRLKWTGAGFLGDIARWLSKTSVGELHGEDQPLEPFLLGGINTVVFPNNLFEEGRAESVYVASVVSDIPDAPYTIKLREIDEEAEAATARRLFCVIAVGNPTLQGAMHECPTNALGLIQLLEQAEIDLLATLVKQSKRIYECAHPPGDEDGLLVLVKLPRLRIPAGPVASLEYWAFGMLPIRDVAIATGRYGAAPEGIGIVPLVVPQYDEAIMREFEVVVFRPVQAIDRDAAKRLSGLEQGTEDPSIVLVGGGAMGSQLHNHLSRMGWGRWTLIDEDTLLPHNVVRHRLGEHAVGFSKALALQQTIDQETPYNALDQAFVENLTSAVSNDDMMTALVNADLILDVSTSIAAARFLALDVTSHARRLSDFPYVTR